MGPPATAFTKLNSPKTAYIAEVESAPSSGGAEVHQAAATSNSIAAVLPSTSVGFVVGSGSDSEEDDTVSSPITVPHLMWKANVWGKDEFQIPIDCMLDDGAHMVLIRPEIVTDLGLHIQKLRKPHLIGLALSDDEDTKVELDSYVTLSLSSLNNEWSARPTRAVIAPNLCADILLGLPFLSHNKIVIDHDLRTAIDKKTDFDLLKPLKNVHEPRRISLTKKQKTKYIKECRKLLLVELKWRCSMRRDELENSNAFEVVREVDIGGAIAATIQRLASTDVLNKYERDLKKEFKEIFEPIPHIDELPTTDLARIQLKDAYQKISRRKYDIPRQFRESFDILIQKRLDSGFIRPSTASNCSPSFIIPKPDPKALPRWVCDYRQLDENTVPDNYPLPRVDDILADCAKGKIWVTFGYDGQFFSDKNAPRSCKIYGSNDTTWSV